MASDKNRMTRLNFTSFGGLWELGRSNCDDGRGPDSTIAEATKTNDHRLEKILENEHKSAHEYEEGLPPAIILNGSPWEHYEQLYVIRLGLDHRAIVAQKRRPVEGGLGSIYSIRTFTEVGQHMFPAIQSHSFVPVYQAFRINNSYYVVSEHMPCSLHEVRANDVLTERRIAAIFRQVSL